MEEEKKTKSTVGVVIAIILITVVAIVAVNLFKGKKKPAFPMSGGMGRNVSSVTSVRTVIAENSVLHDYVVTNGEIETQKSIEVFPSIGGKVVEMKVSLGSPVKAGDVIAYIDPSEPGSYYAKSPVTAPIDGSIITSPVKTGQKVSMSSVITKIGDIDNLQVTAKIPERYIGDLHIGQKAEVSLKAYPEDVFYAKVVRISPVVDPASRTKEIILNFDKKYEKVNAGMFAKVKLFTLDYEGYPTIKQDAFVNNNDEYYLFVVKPDSKVEKRKVLRGKNVDGYYQVLEGVEPGEVVVVEGMLTLYEGAEVNDISGNVAPATPKKSEKTTDSDVSTKKE
ncbi:MAG: efflux RND transporter periplasmic adaptor subunit [Treponema bryantii]|nr:efflux RND transporter periplasmic adaptor subunit [Treponema bryantii]